MPEKWRYTMNFGFPYPTSDTPADATPEMLHEAATALDGALTALFTRLERIERLSRGDKSVSRGW